MMEFTFQPKKTYATAANARKGITDVTQGFDPETRRRLRYTIVADPISKRFAPMMLDTQGNFHYFASRGFTVFG